MLPSLHSDTHKGGLDVPLDIHHIPPCIRRVVLFLSKIKSFVHLLFKKVYNKFKEIEGNFVPTDKYKMGKEEIEQMGENEKQLIEDVFNLMGQYSAWRLRDKTHQEDPWKNNYIKGKKNIKIPKDDIKKYFKRYVENE